MSLTGSFIALLASICWAICAFPFTKAGRSMSVASMNLVRLVVGTLMVMLVAIIVDAKNFAAIFSSQYLQAWLWLGASGIIAIGIGDYCSYKMYTILGPRNGSALATISPAASFLFGLLLLDERMNLIGIIGMAITIMGVLSMSLGKTERNALPDHGHGSIFSGIVLGIIGSACNGAGIVFSKKAFLLQQASGNAINPLIGSFIRFLAATVIVLLITFFNKKIYMHWKNIRQQPLNIKGTILIGIIFGPVLGVSFSLTSIQYINVAVAQTIFALVPVMALLIAHFVYKEKITKHAIAGVLVAIAGVVILIWRTTIAEWLHF
ncbi:MAG: DMT family transporter [Ferruginibacter sp.]